MQTLQMPNLDLWASMIHQHNHVQSWARQAGPSDLCYACRRAAAHLMRSKSSAVRMRCCSRKPSGGGSGACCLACIWPASSALSAAKLPACFDFLAWSTAHIGSKLKYLCM